MLQTLFGFFILILISKREKQRSANAYKQQQLMTNAANYVPLAGNGQAYMFKNKKQRERSVEDSVECKIR